jgi:uncharacterized membrane protein
MENTNKKQGLIYKVFSGILVILNLLVGIWAYPRLPEKVPSHWNAAGAVDAYSGAFQGAFMLPLILVGIFALFWVIPRIDPKKANYSLMGRIFWIIGFVITLFMSVIYWGTIAVALGYLENLPRWTFSGIGILFIILGNYFGKIKFNYTLGIRNPWTLANEEVWYKTHRFAGPIWMVGGVLVLLTGFLPASLVTPLFFGVIMILVFVPTIYSYFVFRKLMNQ